MSRRKTVKLNLDVVNLKIKEACRHNVIFCEKMGRAQNWVTDWNRKDRDGNPTPKNLPSPEEAARMCAILQVTPEEILTEPEDIELVQSLIDSQKPAENEKLAHNVDEPDKDTLVNLIKKTDDMKVLLAVLDELNKKIQKKIGD